MFYNILHAINCILAPCFALSYDMFTIEVDPSFDLNKSLLDFNLPINCLVCPIALGLGKGLGIPED